jgi:hypothetical protein
MMKLRDPTVAQSWMRYKYLLCRLGVFVLVLLVVDGNVVCAFA